jgi:hypothetical protein
VIVYFTTDSADEEEPDRRVLVVGNCVNPEIENCNDGIRLFTGNSDVIGVRSYQVTQAPRSESSDSRV